jgi:hypothetical protein
MRLVTIDNISVTPALGQTTRSKRPQAVLCPTFKTMLDHHGSTIPQPRARCIVLADRTCGGRGRTWARFSNSYFAGSANGNNSTSVNAALKRSSGLGTSNEQRKSQKSLISRTDYRRNNWSYEIKGLKLQRKVKNHRRFPLESTLSFHHENYLCAANKRVRRKECKS